MAARPDRICPGDPELDQWFTPWWAAEELVADALADVGRCGLLEPSCGEGAFLGAFPADWPALGVEIDPHWAAQARELTGRDVLTADFRTVDLGDRQFGAILGNPPFGMPMVEGLVDRAHAILPDEGLLAVILPAFCFQTASRVGRWMDLFSLDVNMIPRQLFPGIKQALVWAKFRKTSGRRFFGLMLFREQYDIEQMPRDLRNAVHGPGTWREVVRLALESLGGAASLPAIYDRITPERRSASRHWQPKVRQILQLYHRPVERGRWAL